MTFYSYFIYIRGIIRKETRPHAFSWFVWASLTAIAFAAQLAEKAGPGAWITGVTALGSFIIFFCALRNSDKDIKKSDWIALISAIVAIVLWKLTDQPLWSVVLVSLIDALAFYPTFRKSWNLPHQEVATSYVLSGLKFAVSIMALETFSITTVLYPASLVFMNAAFVTLLAVRRAALPKVSQNA